MARKHIKIEAFKYPLFMRIRYTSHILIILCWIAFIINIFWGRFNNVPSACLFIIVAFILYAVVYCYILFKRVINGNFLSFGPNFININGSIYLAGEIDLIARLNCQAWTIHVKTKAFPHQSIFNRLAHKYGASAGGVLSLALAAALYFWGGDIHQLWFIGTAILGAILLYYGICLYKLHLIYPIDASKRDDFKLLSQTINNFCLRNKVIIIDEKEQASE